MKINLSSQSSAFKLHAAQSITLFPLVELPVVELLGDLGLLAISLLDGDNCAITSSIFGAFC